MYTQVLMYTHLHCGSGLGLAGPRRPLRPSPDLPRPRRGPGGAPMLPHAQHRFRQLQLPGPPRPTPGPTRGPLLRGQLLLREAGRGPRTRGLQVGGLPGSVPVGGDAADRHPVNLLPRVRAAELHAPARPAAGIRFGALVSGGFPRPRIDLLPQGPPHPPPSCWRIRFLLANSTTT